MVYVDLIRILPSCLLTLTNAGCISIGYSSAILTAADLLTSHPVLKLIHKPQSIPSVTSIVYIFLLSTYAYIINMKFSLVVSALLGAVIAAPSVSSIDKRQVTANDLKVGGCKKVTLIFARASTEVGNMVSTFSS